MVACKVSEYSLSPVMILTRARLIVGRILLYHTDTTSLSSTFDSLTTTLISPSRRISRTKNGRRIIPYKENQMEARRGGKSECRQAWQVSCNTVVRVSLQNINDFEMDKLSSSINLRQAPMYMSRFKDLHFIGSLEFPCRYIEVGSEEPRLVFIDCGQTSPSSPVSLCPSELSLFSTKPRIMAAEAKAQTNLRDFESLFSLEGKVAVVVCRLPL